MKKKTEKAALHTRGVNHSGSCLRSVFTLRLLRAGGRAAGWSFDLQGGFVAVGNLLGNLFPRRLYRLRMNI